MALVKLHCIQCGQEYEVKPYRINSSHFCSPTCSAKWHHGSHHWRYKAQEVQCAQCGKKLTLPAHRTRHAKHNFCSRACKKLWQNGKLQKPIESRLRVERICKICSSLFYVKPSVLKRPGWGIYCSKACFAEARRRNFLESNPDYTDSFKEAMKRHWADPEWAERRIRETIEGLLKRPSSLERILIKFFKEHDLPFKYTGNGSFLIGFKNPDFINVNGLKLCLEIHNSYFNRGDNQYAIKRKNHFAKYGWDCIVIETTERKLSHEAILDTLGKELEQRGIEVK